jgi:hypothetical protein
MDTAEATNGSSPAPDTADPRSAALRQWVRDIAVNTIANLVSVSILWLIAQASGFVTSNSTLNALASLVVGLALLGAIYASVPVAAVRVTTQGHPTIGRFIASLPYAIVAVGEVGGILINLDVVRSTTIEHPSTVTRVLLYSLPFAFVAALYIARRQIRRRVLRNARTPEPYPLLMNACAIGAILLAISIVVDARRQ